MKLSSLKLTTAVLGLAILPLLFTSCRAKKPAPVQPTVEVVEKEESAPVPVEEKVEEAPAPVEKMPDFNYRNIQFEFNSAVLKTSSYEVLDQIGAEIKKYPSVKFDINGHSSAEGTDQRNQTLSVDRANSVKSYLVNLGVGANNLNAVGFGESKPISPNTTEAGRVLNRRVEIDKIN